MTLEDVAAAVLIQSQKFSNSTEAKEAILTTFKTEFPYWGYADWNQPVPYSTIKALLRIYHDNSDLSIKELIVDLPALVEAFKNSKSD